MKTAFSSWCFWASSSVHCKRCCEYIPFMDDNAIHQHTIRNSRFYIDFSISAQRTILQRCFFRYISMVGNRTASHLRWLNATLWRNQWRCIRRTEHFIPQIEQLLIDGTIGEDGIHTNAKAIFLRMQCIAANDIAAKRISVVRFVEQWCFGDFLFQFTVRHKFKDVFVFHIHVDYR